MLYLVGCAPAVIRAQPLNLSALGCAQSFDPARRFA